MLQVQVNCQPRMSNLLRQKRENSADMSRSASLASDLLQSLKAHDDISKLTKGFKPA